MFEFLARGRKDVTFAEMAQDGGPMSDDGLRRIADRRRHTTDRSTEPWKSIDAGKRKPKAQPQDSVPKRKQDDETKPEEKAKTKTAKKAQGEAKKKSEKPPDKEPEKPPARSTPDSLAPGATSALPDAFRKEFGMRTGQVIVTSKSWQEPSYTGPMKGQCAFHFLGAFGCSRGGDCDRSHQLHARDVQRAKGEIKKATGANTAPNISASSVTSQGTSMAIGEPPPPSSPAEDRRSRSRSPSDDADSDRSGVRKSWQRGRSDSSDSSRSSVSG